MGRKSGQIQMIIMDISELIPEGHLLNRIDALVSFDFIYEKLLPYYSTKGRPSVDPVCMFKMLFVGYLYSRLYCNKSTGKYLRCYQTQGIICAACVQRPNCFETTGNIHRILASSCYPAFRRGHQRIDTPEYHTMIRKRKIWAEGSFAVMKREHNLARIRKKGILRAGEECLLSAIALNLKRMVKTVSLSTYKNKIWEKA